MRSFRNGVIITKILVDRFRTPNTTNWAQDDFVWRKIEASPKSRKCQDCDPNKCHLPAKCKAPIFFGIMTSQFKTPCRDPKKHPNVRASLALPPMLSRWSCYLCVNEDKSHWVSRHCPSPTHSPKKHGSFSDLEFGKELELAILQIGKARNKKK